MRKNVAGLLIMMMWVVYPQVSKATVTVYENDTTAETEFDAAVIAQGLSPLDTIDFDELDIGDVIDDLYNPPVKFVTEAGHNILADDNAYNSPPHSEELCAVAWQSQGAYSFFELQFDESVYGASLWILDIYLNVNVTVFDGNNEILEEINLSRPGAEQTYLGVLSDVKEIARIQIESTYLDSGTGYSDGLGFDDVTIVPEPATLLLFGLGGLCLRRFGNAQCRLRSGQALRRKRK